MARQVSDKTIKEFQKQIKIAIRDEKEIQKSNKYFTYSEELGLPIHDFATRKKDIQKEYSGYQIKEITKLLKKAHKNPDQFMVTLSSEFEQVKVGEKQVQDRFGGSAGTVPVYEKIEKNAWRESKIRLEYIDRELSARNISRIYEAEAFKDASRIEYYKDETGRIIKTLTPMIDVIPKNREKKLAGMTSGHPVLYKLPDGTILGDEGLSISQVEEIKSLGLMIPIKDRSDFNRVYNSIQNRDIEISLARRENLFENYFKALKEGISESFAKEIKKLFKQLNITDEEFYFLFKTTDAFDFGFIYSQEEYRQFTEENRKEIIRSEVENLRKIQEEFKQGNITSEDVESTMYKKYLRMMEEYHSR